MKCMGISALPCAHSSSVEWQERLPFALDLQLFADGDKTEEPTSKRRSDAKKKGQVGRSTELSTAFVLLIGFFTIKMLAQSIYNELYAYMTYIFGHLDQTLDVENIVNLFLEASIVFGKTALPIMLAIMLIGLGINFFQVGLNFNTEKLEPKLSNLNPINGVGRMFSKRSLVELVKSLLKIIVIGAFLYMVLKDQILAMPQFIYYDLDTSLGQMINIVLKMAFQICGVIMVIGVLDYGYQKWQTTQDLKMTKQEVKDEFKQTEGDPQIKGKIRQKQRQMAMARMMKEVPKADVIVTNPTHFAVALEYHKGMTAPKVLAKGQDLVAQKIKAIGRENHVPLVENVPLARALYRTTEIGDFIPQELYQSVAEVLAYVYRLKHHQTA